MLKTTFEKPTLTKKRSYAIIIDAGSSGSRVFIYSWELSTDKHTLPQIDKGSLDDSKWMFKEKNGLSSFNIDNVGNHLSPLLEFASNLIPKTEHASSILFLFATAGMRLLDKSKQTKILDASCLFAKQNTMFFIESCVDQFRIISGEAEGESPL